MKTRIILFGFFAAVLVLTLIACKNDDDDDTGTGTTYTVKFSLNGGQGSTPADQTVNSGGSITLPSGSGISRSGYLFGGWNASSGGTGTNYEADSSFAPVSNTTLYAKWNDGNTYTVVFHSNGGDGSVSEQTVTKGGSITLPSGDGITRYGYAFSGWNTMPNGLGTGYETDGSFTPTGDITLYAQWIQGYSVRFDRNEAKGTPPTTMIGVTVTLPDKEGLTFAYATFEGWNTRANGSGTNYSKGSSFTPTGTTTLYAQWQWDGTTYASLTTLKTQLAWLEVHAQNNQSYVAVATADESIEPNPLPHGGIQMSGVTITIKSSGGKRTVDLASNGSMFTLKPGVTLVLEDIILRGRNGNNAPLVTVNGGALTLENGSEISGNTTSIDGGGVYISYSSFTMNGGTITGNSGRYGGGVYVGYLSSGNSVTMNGGTISGNTASLDGGGVYIRSSFTMSDGTISGNTAYQGGGVYIPSYAAFIMSGGTVTGNTAYEGGGVYMTGQINFGTLIVTGSGTTITGYETDNVNGNRAESGYGHSAFFADVRNPTPNFSFASSETTFGGYFRYENGYFYLSE